MIFPGFLPHTWSSIEERYLWLDAPLRSEGACFWLVPAADGPEPRHVAELRRIGATVVHCRLSPGRWLGNFLRLRALFRREGIDVVYTHFGPLRFQVEAAARLCGVRVARGEHNFAFHHDRRFRMAKRMFWRWATDWFVPVSNAVAAHLREAGVMHGNGTVVHDGFDLARDPPPDPASSRRALQDELGLDRRARLLVCVAKIHPAKQQHVLVEMMDGLRDRQVVLLLAGAVADEAYDAALKARVAALGIQDRVHCLGYRTDVARLMDAADISYLPSLVEGLGNVVVESLLMGTPVIASDLPAIREILASGQHGYLTPAGDVAGHAMLTRRLLDDEASRAAMGSAGRAHVAGKFSRELFERRSVEALRRCAGIGGRRARASP